MKTTTFETWMDAVNTIIETRTGCSAADLPDVCYADMHDDGITPARAAARAIKNARDEGEF